MDKNKKLFVIGSALLVAAIGAGIYFHLFSSAPAPAPEPAASAVARDAVPAAAPPAESLPNLKDSDAFVRIKAGFLSSAPAFSAWLKTDDLIPRFAAAVSLIGRGRVPKDGLSFLAPRKKFLVRKAGDALVLDPRGYARYDAAAAAVDSIDAAAAARLFREIEPLLRQAYQELGEKNGDVADATARAIQELLKAPILDGKIELTEKGIGYAYSDPSLENLSAAQKQLLRMGPKNAAKIQDKLRDFLKALGAAPSSSAR